MKNYQFYFCDVETTGLFPHKHDILEISLIRLKDGEQKTWNLKPINPETIDLGALKINGIKLEDITHQTKFGRETYLDPNKTIVEIENWLMEDEVPAEDRFLIGQNIGRFDMPFLEQLWMKCNSHDSFPFGRRIIDTMVIELFHDFCKGEFAEGYSLSNFCKKYGVKNDKSHTAAADTKATKEVFLKQVEYFKKILSKIDG